MLKVIIKLGGVPDQATVTRLGSSIMKEYRVTDRVDIYDEDGSRHRIHANEGCRYLIAKEGGVSSINAFGFNKEVIWHTDLEELNRLAEKIETK